VVNVVLSLLLIRPLSFGGLALANSVATTAEMIVLAWLMRRRLGDLDLRRIGSSLVRIGLASGLMAAGIGVLTRRLSGVDSLLSTVLAILVGGAVYLLATLLLGSDEINAILRLARRTTSSTSQGGAR
jgi:putative peptidoglycan lipid II flippase